MYTISEEFLGLSLRCFSSRGEHEENMKGAASLLRHREGGEGVYS